MRVCWVILIFGYCQLVSAHDWYTKYGDIGQAAIPAIAGGIALYNKDYAGTYQLVLSVAASLAVTHSLKHIVRSKRPHGGKNSFPSGHTTSAMNGAVFIHKRYGIWYSLPFYGAAAMVGHSRVAARAHWPIDILGASVISYMITSWLTDKYQNNVEVAVLPIEDDGIAITATYSIA